MHTYRPWHQETPIQRTERFGEWYDRYTDEFEGEPTTVTVHEIWEQYGGPEEGGWTYQCGYPIETVCVFSRAQALRVLHELHEKYDTEEYEEQTFDICLSNKIAKWYPDRRPHYE
jgi:hypothetical protein